jgi:hypothetical protein
VTLSESAIEHMAGRIKLEAGGDYFVADYAMVDWCPCCGVNIRFFKDEKFIGKLIAKPFEAGKLARGIMALVKEMVAEAPDDAAKKAICERVHAKILEAADLTPESPPA